MSTVQIKLLLLLLLLLWQSKALSKSYRLLHLVYFCASLRKVNGNSNKGGYKPKILKERMKPDPNFQGGWRGSR